MGWLRVILLALAAVGCEHDSDVGTDYADGPGGGDARADANGDGPPACACDASSCAGRICGRSDCGFPCGVCADSDWCVQGTQCQPGPGPGTPCIDAFGYRVWEGDRGHATCPENPPQTRICMCTGGGADAWASCDPCGDVCLPGAVNGIACVDETCAVPGEVCCISAQDTASTTCSGTCTPNNYTRACDGPEDCTGAICCGGDLPWTASCSAVTDCGPLAQLCHDTSECPASEPHCCPRPGQDVKACSATLGPACT